MNNLPLQPLVWDSQNYTQSAFHQYLVRKDGEARKNSKSQYEVAYGRLNTQKSMNIATGFTTIDEAKAWAWSHYNEKMQPYVKPSPTWVDTSEQLPQVDVDTQFICAYDSAIDTFSKVAWFNADIGKFDYQHDDVLAWMPIPEFSTMQNLHKGGVIVNGFKLCTNCGKKRFMDSDRYHPIDDKGACHECQLKSEADND